VLRQLLRSRIAVLLAGVSLCADSAAEPAPEAVICLCEAKLPEDLHDRRAQVEAQLSGVLRKLGFRVVEVAAVAPIVERVERESGGSVDPLTGGRDWGRLHAFERALGRALRDELGCTALMEPTVVALVIEWNYGRAYWDGVSAMVVTASRIAYQGGIHAYDSGYVGALSLWLELRDLDGRELRFRSGGIELLAQLDTNGWQYMPKEALLTHPERLQVAVERAVGLTGQWLRDALGG
jgi:hypothetical protein